MPVSSVVSRLSMVAAESVGGAIVGGRLTHDPRQDGAYINISSAPGAVMGAVAGPVVCEMVRPVAVAWIRGGFEAGLRAVPSALGNALGYGAAGAAGGLAGAYMASSRAPRRQRYAGLVEGLFGCAAGMCAAPLLFALASSLLKQERC